MDVSRLDEQLDELISPLTKMLAEVEDEIRATEDLLGELRDARRKLVSVRDKIHPPVKQNGRVDQQVGQVAETKIVALADWFQAHRDEVNSGRGAYASGLYENPDFTVITNQSQISKALAILHSRGIIRLDSVGMGGRKNFKVV